MEDNLLTNLYNNYSLKFRLTPHSKLIFSTLLVQNLTPFIISKIVHNKILDVSNTLKVLAYFDIFDSPLLDKEIVNLTNESNLQEDIIKTLLNTQKCYKYNNYYSLKKNVKELVTKRLKKEKEAQKYIKKLPFFVSLISKFPFVRGIAISGSLSKGVMYADGDIDYFIITAANRLWICRSFLIIFKKIFLLNSKKYFCVNYFVDENNLEIHDQNMFTAVEISYLKPVYNEAIINQLKEKNSWIKGYFPNFVHPFNFPLKTNKNNKNKGLESIFTDSFADKFDLWLMKKTFKRWENKFKHFNKEKFELTMRTNRGVSKHHPQDFQNKVLRELDEKMLNLKI